jgi:hypothetical protein
VNECVVLCFSFAYYITEEQAAATRQVSKEKKQGTE